MNFYPSFLFALYKKPDNFCCALLLCEIHWKVIFLYIKLFEGFINFSICQLHNAHLILTSQFFTDDYLEPTAWAKISRLCNILSTRRSTMTPAASGNLLGKSQKGSEGNSQMAVAENRYCDATKYHKSSRGRKTFLHDESAGGRYLVDFPRDRYL